VMTASVRGDADRESILRIFSAEEGRSAPEFSAALRDSRRVDMTGIMILKS